MLLSLEFNWRQGGRVVRSHTSADDGVVTSVAIDAEWIVVGLANHRIHVFSNKTGLLARTLIGHTLGVWCLNLVSKGGTPFRTRTSSESKASASTSNALPTSASTTSLPSRPSDVEEPTPTMNWGDYTNLRSSDACNSSLGWGQEGALVVSGACDRDVRVWDIKSGYFMSLPSFLYSI
jgi:F-box and WD-40 domain protein CDC4